MVQLVLVVRDHRVPVYHGGFGCLFWFGVTQPKCHLDRNRETTTGFRWLDRLFFFYMPFYIFVVRLSLQFNLQGKDNLRNGTFW
jgi:hypothetical protein